MSIKIALVGNPNSGKTTLFNDITGSNQYVGNWPGVTVEKKEGRLRGIGSSQSKPVIIDLPGVYSLSPYSLEEVITRNYLVLECPDVILNIVDASNLERNLYLTTQLMEVGIPLVIALNMMDIIAKNGDLLNVEMLSALFGCPVIETSAVKGKGCYEAVKCAVNQAKFSPPSPVKFSVTVENALQEIQSLISKYRQDSKLNRWYAIKLFERDKKVIDKLALPEFAVKKIENIIKVCEAEMDDDSESIITNQRYLYVEKIVQKCLHKKQIGLSSTEKIDLIVTNRLLALPLFAVIMFIVYFISVSSFGTFITDWTNEVLFDSWIAGGAAYLLEQLGTAHWLKSLVIDGLVGGVGSVLGFVPQMVLLFFFLSFLEDCGYMARIAFIMDCIFRKFGMSGKSFIPMLVASGCGVPGIMASRTIENEKDRRMTVMLTTFIPCGAKLPLIALIAGSIFPQYSWWVAPSIYFLGVIMIILSALILKKTKLFKGDTAPFVMELPNYHLPAPKNLFIHVWKRSKAFIIKAGTVIFLASGVIWFLSNFSWEFKMAGQENSILAGIGQMIAPFFSPLGFEDWRASVATITGLAAKENIVSTLSVLIGISDSTSGNTDFMTAISGIFNSVSAYSFMAFNMLCAPCIAAIGAIHREMGSAKWTFITIGYQTLIAYSVSFIIYQIGRVIVLGNPITFGTILSIGVLVLFFWLLLKPDSNSAKLHTNKAFKQNFYGI
jgi:ferrous iron transport protein B